MKIKTEKAKITHVITLDSEEAAALRDSLEERGLCSKGGI